MCFDKRHNLFVAGKGSEILLFLESPSMIHNLPQQIDEHLNLPINEPVPETTA
jgi:hypothetical protein